MRPSPTEDNIKKPILDLINREFQFILEEPSEGAREYPIHALDKTFWCDFAFRIRSGGWCFIEDDSDGTCLSNLLKYSAWIEEQNPPMPVLLMHIVSPSDSAWIRLCRREGVRLQTALQEFKYSLITTPDWPPQNPKWLVELRLKLKDATTASS